MSVIGARILIPCRNIFVRIPHSSNSLRPLSSETQVNACSSTKLCSRPLAFTPLFERPLTHNTSIKELLTWQSWAKGQALAVGDTYLQLDGGPNAEDLLRELEWMLEDAVNGTSLQSTSQIKNLKWRDIRVSQILQEDEFINIRASLEELSSLWTERVKRRRPFQYVVGCAHWRDYVLCVKEGVLIPRPETEQMIDIAEDAMKEYPKLCKGLWADLGTGSGALAIALGHILDDEGAVVAVDISKDALSVASLNVARYNLQNKIEVLEGSWFSALNDKKGMLAGVLSNPPYIPSVSLASLQAEVGKYEPREALDGGHNGTTELITICHGAADRLQSNGCLILETNGGGQAEIMAEYLKSMSGRPFQDIKLVKDYAGIVRFIKASRA